MSLNYSLYVSDSQHALLSFLLTTNEVFPLVGNPHCNYQMIPFTTSPLLQPSLIKKHADCWLLPSLRHMFETGGYPKIERQPFNAGGEDSLHIQETRPWIRYRAEMAPFGLDAAQKAERIERGPVSSTFINHRALDSGIHPPPAMARRKNEIRFLREQLQV